jgi:hypothetical protein
MRNVFRELAVVSKSPEDCRTFQHVRFSIAGYPKITDFATSFGMPVWAMAMAPSQNRQLTRDADLTAKNSVTADLRASRQAHLSAEKRSPFRRPPAEQVDEQSREKSGRPGSGKPGRFDVTLSPTA